MATNLQLGSGELFVVAVPTGTLSALSTYCTDGNRLGWIQGGATIEYKPTTYDVKDDMGAVYEHFITDEEVTMKSGILTWNMDVLQKLVNNETYTPASTGVPAKLVIGKKGFNAMEKWLIVFKATIDTAGTTRWFGIVGTSDNGLTLAYQPDKETVIDATFKACRQSAGELLIIEEQAATT